MKKEEDDGLAYGVPLLVLGMAFVGVVCVACLYFKYVRGDKERGWTDPKAERLAAAIRTHPDPEVGQDFLGRDGRGGMRVVFEDLSYADGQFSVVDGRPVLAIRPSLADEAKTAEGMQKLWGVLSHEHAHYLQWREGAAYMTAIHPLSETLCTQALTLEIDAYGKACRDARAFHWDNVLYQCNAIDLPSIAKEKIADLLPQSPECENVWRFFAAKQEAPSEAAPAAPMPERRPPAPAPPKAKPAPATEHAPTYLAPP